MHCLLETIPLSVAKTKSCLCSALSIHSIATCATNYFELIIEVIMSPLPNVKYSCILGPLICMLLVGKHKLVLCIFTHNIQEYATLGNGYIIVWQFIWWQIGGILLARMS